MQHKKAEYFSLLTNFIRDRIERTGVSPTLSEISRGTGIAKTTVSRYLSYMREQNMLHYSGHRGIVLGERPQFLRVPVLGAVSCGIPKFAEENIEDYVSLPMSLFGQGEFFMLRASGDSMTEVGIDDGDLVLIHRQDTAQAGQIVVALMEDEATLKRFFPEPERGRVRLHPENCRLQDIYVDHCVIQGVAVTVMKDLR